MTDSPCIHYGQNWLADVLIQLIVIVIAPLSLMMRIRNSTLIQSSHLHKCKNLQNPFSTWARHCSTPKKVILFLQRLQKSFWIMIITCAFGLLNWVVKRLLHQRNPSAIQITQITVLEINVAASHLSEEELQSVKNPVKLLPLEEEWSSLNERLWHLPFAVMFCLCKAAFLPKKFIKLQNSQPPCISCLFGQAHRKPWQLKSSKDGKVSKLRGPALSKAGQTITVGADQLTSAKPGLVPQEKGCLTCAWVWTATVFINFYTWFVYVSLMTDQMAETTLEAKHSFEHFVATRNIEI